MMKFYFAAGLILLAAVLLRLAPLFPETAPLANFAPLLAIALCGGAFLPGALAWALPFGALLISDLFLNLHYGTTPLGSFMLITYGCYAAALLIGRSLSRNPRLLPMLGGALAASFLFYFVTNTASWLANPAYTKTLAGWVQSLSIGVPGYPPTWTFFRNSLLSDLLFTALFTWSMAAAAVPRAVIKVKPAPLTRSLAPTAPLPSQRSRA